MQEKLKIIILIIILICVVFINIILGIIKSMETPEVINTEENIQNNSIEENTINQIDISNMTEGDRIRNYLSTYMSYLEKDEYQKAYDLLYPEFKQNYFKTLEEFENYIEERYPMFITYNQDDIQRQGNYFILEITILSDSDDKENFSQRFVIYENGINDFVLSFEVI